MTEEKRIEAVIDALLDEYGIDSDPAEEILRAFASEVTREALERAAEVANTGCEDMCSPPRHGSHCGAVIAARIRALLDAEKGSDTP